MKVTAVLVGNFKIIPKSYRNIISCTLRGCNLFFTLKKYITYIYKPSAHGQDHHVSVTNLLASNTEEAPIQA